MMAIAVGLGPQMWLFVETWLTEDAQSVVMLQCYSGRLRTTWLPFWLPSRLRTTKVGFWQAWSAEDKLGIVIATEIGSENKHDAVVAIWVGLGPQRWLLCPLVLSEVT